MRKILLATSALALGVSAFSQSAMADVDANALILQKLDALQKQVASQNAEIAKLKANVSSSASSGGGSTDSAEYDVEEYVSEYEDGFSLNKIKVGGWADFIYQDNDIEGNNQITSPNSLFLTFDAQLSDRWRFFGELAFEGGPLSVGEGTEEGQLRVERIYLEYNYSDQLNARIGKFSTPMGLWTPEHWAFNVPSVSVPFFVEGRSISHYSNGLEGFGNYTLGGGEWAPDIEYYAWLSSGDMPVGTMNAVDDKLAQGANVTATFNEMIKVGLGVNRRSNAMEQGRRELSLLPHFELYLPQNVTISGEYLYQDLNLGFADTEAWYTSAKWQFVDDMYVYYRRGQGENVHEGLGQNEDSNTFTLGYSPKPFIRTKLEYSTYEFEATSVEDYNQWNAWIGVAF